MAKVPKQFGGERFDYVLMAYFGINDVDNATVGQLYAWLDKPKMLVDPALRQLIDNEMLVAEKVNNDNDKVQKVGLTALGNQYIVANGLLREKILNNPALAAVADPPTKPDQGPTDEGSIGLKNMPTVDADEHRVLKYCAEHDHTELTASLLMFALDMKQIHAEGILGTLHEKRYFGIYCEGGVWHYTVTLDAKNYMRAKNLFD